MRLVEHCALCRGEVTGWPKVWWWLCAGIPLHRCSEWWVRWLEFDVRPATNFEIFAGTVVPLDLRPRFFTGSAP
jgi:hypothetical protein